MYSNFQCEKVIDLKENASSINNSDTFGDSNVSMEKPIIRNVILYYCFTFVMDIKGL